MLARGLVGLSITPPRVETRWISKIDGAGIGIKVAVQRMGLFGATPPRIAGHKHLDGRVVVAGAEVEEAGGGVLLFTGKAVGCAACAALGEEGAVGGVAGGGAEVGGNHFLADTAQPVGEEGAGGCTIGLAY